MKTASMLLVGACLSALAQYPDHHEALGPHYEANPAASAKTIRPARKGLDAVRRWNEIAINASGLDHTPVATGETRVFGEQLGPCRAARAMGIVHIAMFDTVNAVVGNYESFTGVPAPMGAVSLRAAISEAAHDTLTNLFPSQTADFNALLADDLNDIRDSAVKLRSVRLGSRAAAAIIKARIGDGSEHPEPLLGVDYFTTDAPGHWRQDPISLAPLALGAHWPECKPFVMQSADQFRAPPPPFMDSPDYTAAYNEAKRFGGDGVVTPTERTPEQTIIGTYWAYDGTPSLCAPPRMYNQIVLHIADQMASSELETARLLALINVAMADAGLAVWDSKFHYDFWRPITAIRESDELTGPTGTGDGNPDTMGDPTFTPLGAPASNLNGPNFTPPFPSYPSGHAGFGGAVFEILRRFYGRDDIAFTFVSDEFNGVTRDHDGGVRPLMERSFTSLSEAEEENGQSRIYLGIHWSFDKTAGIAQGRQVGDYVFEHMFRPRHH
jgi:hypothetical protein